MEPQTQNTDLPHIDISEENSHSRLYWWFAAAVIILALLAGYYYFFLNPADKAAVLLEQGKTELKNNNPDAALEAANEVLMISKDPEQKAYAQFQIANAKLLKKDAESSLTELLDIASDTTYPALMRSYAADYAVTLAQLSPALYNNLATSALFSPVTTGKDQLSGSIAILESARDTMAPIGVSHYRLAEFYARMAGASADTVRENWIEQAKASLVQGNETFAKTTLGEESFGLAYLRKAMALEYLHTLGETSVADPGEEYKTAINAATLAKDSSTRLEALYRYGAYLARSFGDARADEIMEATNQLLGDSDFKGSHIDQFLASQKPSIGETLVLPSTIEELENEFKTTPALGALRLAVVNASFKKHLIELGWNIK